MFSLGGGDGSDEEEHRRRGGLVIYDDDDEYVESHLNGWSIFNSPLENVIIAIKEGLDVTPSEFRLVVKHSLRDVECMRILTLVRNNARQSALYTVVALRPLLGRDVARIIGAYVYSTRKSDAFSWWRKEQGWALQAVYEIEEEDRKRPKFEKCFP